MPVSRLSDFVRVYQLHGNINQRCQLARSIRLVEFQRLPPYWEACILFGCPLVPEDVNALRWLHATTESGEKEPIQDHFTTAQAAGDLQ